MGPVRQHSLYCCSLSAFWCLFPSLAVSALGQQCLLLLLVLLLVLLNPAHTFINGPLLSSPQLHRLCHLYPARKLAVQRLAILEHRLDLQEEGHYFIIIILSLTEIQI